MILEDWGLFVDGVNPVARTNVAPEVNPPSRPVLFGFEFEMGPAGRQERGLTSAPPVPLRRSPKRSSPFKTLVTETLKDFIARHVFHPLQGMTLGDWWALLRRHRFAIDLQNSPRGAGPDRLQRLQFGQRPNRAVAVRTADRGCPCRDPSIHSRPLPQRDHSIRCRAVYLDSLTNLLAGIWIKTKSLIICVVSGDSRQFPPIRQTPPHPLSSFLGIEVLGIECSADPLQPFFISIIIWVGDGHKEPCKT